MKTFVYLSIRIGIILSLFFFLGCSKENDLTNDQEKTLQSFTQVNDYPFYTMQYHGDYGFSKFIRTGRYPNVSGIRISEEKYACTSFFAMGSDTCRIFGRNFDWTPHLALLITTDPPDGYASVSMIDMAWMGFSASNPPDPDHDQAWLLHTPFTPVDGINECGLAISLMMVDHAEPPYSASKNTIYTGNVIRLILDYARNIDEAIDLLGDYNIDFQESPCHYLLAESSGRSVILEFLNNEMVVNETDEKWQVCTNFIIHGSQAPRVVYCQRYKNAYDRLKHAAGNIDVSEAMDILELVAQQGQYETMWSVVYDLTTLEAQVAIGRNYQVQYTYKIADKSAN